MYLTQGILTALYQRESTGLGCKIDIAMLDAQLAILEHAVAIASVTGAAPGPTGARHPSITPFSTYRAADGFFVIAAGNDALFAKLCDALDLPDLAKDLRFVTNAARCENVALLKRLIESQTLNASRAHWIARLERFGVPTGKVQNVSEALEDPQLLARNMVLPITPRPGGPAFVGAGNPIKMTGLEERVAHPSSPALDQDRATILEWLAAAEKQQTAKSDTLPKK